MLTWIRSIQRETFWVVESLLLKVLLTIWAILGSRICYWGMFESKSGLTAHYVSVSHADFFVAGKLCKDIL
jgi:hypothetical protein